VALGMLACGQSTGETTSDAGADATAPAHCAIDPVFPLHTADGGTGSCFAARYALSCSASSIGASATCISDDPTRCDTGTVETSGCVSKCAANEYGAACGPAIGDAGTTNPPSSCRVLFAAPGGHPYYCCTCE
jgi:hypothetical protein